jgi:hypothetical protein
MNALKTARKLISAHPESQAAAALAQLIQALECERKINVLALYALQPNEFELAIDVLKQWRIDRRTASRDYGGYVPSHARFIPAIHGASVALGAVHSSGPH